ncbi:hypothetical protein BH10BDE1_BH10BDE1_33730 [soil metagenome]
MSSNKLFLVFCAVLVLASAAWIVSRQHSSATVMVNPRPVDAGSAALAPTGEETDWASFQDNVELGSALSETFRGHFSDDIEKSNPEWVQSSREAFAKMESLAVKEARIEPELGLSTPSVFYTLTRTDGSTVDDEARELPNDLPFAILLSFDANRTVRVKTATTEKPTEELKTQFANLIVAIVNREQSKSAEGSMSNGY